MHNDQHPHPFQREEHRRHFEQIVDDALHVDDIAQALTASTDLNAEQLRTATLAQADVIAAKAPAEYRHLVETEDRTLASRTEQASAPFAESAEGVGILVLATWTTIIVATVSAAVFLGAYYAIKLATNHDKSVAPMRMVGVASLVIALGAAVLAGLAMLLHAGRNRGTPAQTKEVRTAREAWELALLERGILPFMTAHLAASAGDATVIPLPAPRLNGRRPRRRDRDANGHPEGSEHAPEGDQPTDAVR